MQDVTNPVSLHPSYRKYEVTSFLDSK